MDARDLTAEVDLDVAPRGARVDLHDPRERGGVEDALRSIPGVLAARIVPGFDRLVDEVHVLTTLDRGPKLTVRDIQSMLLARYGVSIDHRVISVVQLDEEQASATAPRVVITEVSITHHNLSAQARVTVDDGHTSRTGEADGPASAAGRRRTTARATLDALRPLITEDRVVEIEGVEVTEVLGHEVAISFVHFHTLAGETTVVGSAMVRRDENDAIARSVLDACNRALEER